MDYTKLRNQAKVKKYQGGGWFSSLISKMSSIIGEEGLDTENLGNIISNFGKDESKFGQSMNKLGTWVSNIGTEDANKENLLSEKAKTVFGGINNIVNDASNIGGKLVNSLNTAKDEDAEKSWKDTSKEALGKLASGNWWEATGGLLNKGLDTAEEAIMGDKNFNQNSKLIDNSVRTASKALAKTGPGGLLAAGLLESANFIDKAVGKTVQGFEIGEVGPGFNGIETDQESASFRGTQSRKMKQALARRTEALNMALTANEITEEEQFQMTARMNSRDNILNANRIALAGGLDTSLLGG